MNIYSRWNNEGAPRPSLSSELPSLAAQQFRDEADVNNLIERYKKTGSFYNPLTPQGTPRVPTYQDISELPDTLGQLQILKDVEQMFAALPAKVRDDFGNNVATFVSWAQGKPEALAKLGIIDPISVPKKPAADAAGSGSAGAAAPAAANQNIPAADAAGQSAQPST